jgi:DNA (cytosine-5)-methyltransferase 1
MSKRKPKAIDLFSGCGGLSQGLKQAGFSVVAAIEADPLAMSTFAMNHPRTHRHLGDITKLSARQLMRDLGMKPGELDLLAGCPPCQGFSTLRTMNGSNKVVDPMNDLVFEVTRFAHAFRPRALMIENVPGLLRDARFETMTARLERLGYAWSAEVFDAADFGVPQRRRRMILIATRGFEPQFAPPVMRRRTVAGAIRKLPEPKRSRDPLHNYEVSRAKHVAKLIAQIPKDGGSRTSLGPSNQLDCHKRQDGFYDIYGRMSWSKPGPTITGSCINPSKGRFLHPESNRAITLREAALLQGFPPRYQFDTSRGIYPTAQMIGNAFPPPFAARHARVLRKTIALAGEHRKLRA